MPRFIVTAIQGGADTTSSATIETGIVADSKSGILITGFDVHWVNGSGVAAADYEVRAQLNTVSGALAFSSVDQVDQICWGLQNTAGVAVAVPYEPTKQIVLTEPRLTVQPNIYFTLSSTGTAQANQATVRVYYEIVKLTDIELLRLLVGGA